MPGQFLSPEGDLEDYFVTEYWLIDQYIGDELWAWGEGASGQLGGAFSGANRSTPITTFAGGTNWKQVSAGSNFTAAIKTDGTLWTWGSNGVGQLGNSTTTNRNTPVTTFSGGTNWRQISCKGTHTAAIKTDGTLWIWGANTFGKLGTNDITPSRSTPVTTFAGGTNWRQVSSGINNTAAIKTDGTLWVWGAGFNGNTGANNSSDASVPVTTFAGGTNWKQVSCGVDHIMAIKTDGTLWGWGSGNRGVLGTASFSNTLTPVTTFAGGTNWKQVSAGGSSTAEFTLAIKTNRTLWGWGSEFDGKLGNGVITNTVKSTPVTTFAGGTNWKQVTAGDSSALAIKTDGTLWTWGDGNSGRLGSADTTDKSTPVTTFAGGTNWKQAAVGNASVAITSGINPEYPLS